MHGIVYNKPLKISLIYNNVINGETLFFDIVRYCEHMKTRYFVRHAHRIGIREMFKFRIGCALEYGK